MWYAYLILFLAGGFFANGVPHFVWGISGEPFQSPFASPPGVGLSSPLTNVLWGLFNFGAGYILTAWMSTRLKSKNRVFQVMFTGFAVISVALSIGFERVRQG